MLTFDMADSRARIVLRWVAGVVVLAIALWLLGRYSATYAVPFARWVRSLGAWGPVVFIVAYALSELVLIPASLFTLTAGALFGFLAGGTYAFIGAMLGALAAFLSGRYAVRPLVRRRVARDARFRRIDAVAARGGAVLVALLRLSPVLPYAVLNYALGITAVRLRDYVLGTLAILPATLVYTYYGTVVATLTGLTRAPHRGPAIYVLGAVGIVATVAAGVMIGRIARTRLDALESSVIHAS